MASDERKGWRVTACATCLNLCNVIYVWSVFKGEIKSRIAAGDPDWDWDANFLNAPYSVAAITFAFTNFPAGYCYDRLGPRAVTSFGGVLMLAGLFVCSLSTSLPVWVFGYGLCACCGLSISHVSLTPTAVKWFPPARTGLVAGIVVAGFGLSPVYLSPLVSLLIHRFGILMTMRILGVFFFLLTVTLAQFLENPPVRAPTTGDFVTGPGRGAMLPASGDFTLREALGTRTLWLMWLLFGLGGGCGVMVIGEGATMASQAMGKHAWIALVVLSVGNSAGRVVSGVVHDRIGLRRSLLLFFSCQALMMLVLALIPKDSAPCVLLVVTLLGFNYGANPCLWSVATKLFFGTEKFGAIYGVVLTGWGLGGLCLSTVGHVAREATGSIDTSAIMAMMLLLISDVLILFLEPPVKPGRTVSLELGGGT